MDRNLAIARRDNPDCDFVTGSFFYKRRYELTFEFCRTGVALEIQDTKTGRYYPNVANRIESMCLRWEDIDIPGQEETVYEVNGFSSESDLINYLYS